MAAEGEFLKRFVFASGVEPDADDDDEVYKDDGGVERQGKVVLHARSVLTLTR